MQSNMITIKNFFLANTLSFQSTPVLIYNIQYPQFQNPNAYPSHKEINRYYKENAEAFECYCKKNMYHQAIEQYQYSLQHNLPIISYEAKTIYKITYLTESIVSLYFDQYTFTGGAHGSTYRYSNTWNLKTDALIELKDFFPHQPNFKETIIQSITKQIGKQIEKQFSNNQTYYFEDYKDNVPKEFRENNFYLTPNGIVIYFQQYDIAPYSSGLPQFLIPFSQQNML